jgi:hypothetical protein
MSRERFWMGIFFIIKLKYQLNVSKYLH